MANEDKDQRPVVRIAPSPTGNLHIGTARSALYNFLFARKYGGKFILRIEDTDKGRSTKEFEKNITDGLSWLGLPHNEFYRQSEREVIYKDYLKKIIDEGKAYISKETPKEEGDREEVVRFKNPNIKITFEDLIRGQVTFDTTELGDFVIAKSLDEPLYNFAVAIDDHEMGITHIIRGEDHISNTPRQILIQEAIGAERPFFAHIPIILAPDRSKLSKRRGATSITEYREKGYLPVALVNYLALLGWNPGTEQEIFSLEELIDIFDLSRVQKGGAIFDEEKLKWVDSEHRKRLSKVNPEILIVERDKAVETAMPGLSVEEKGRIMKVIEASEVVYATTSKQVEFLLGGSADFAREIPLEYQKESLLWKPARPSDSGHSGGSAKDSEAAKRHIEEVIKILETIPEDKFNKEAIKAAIWPYAEKAGRGEVLWPMRFALSGKEKSPDPFLLAEILGKDLSLKRIRDAVKKLQNEI